MAIRKDLDDMLNSLMDGGGGGSTPARSHNTPRSVRKSKFDDMSVDDLLHALEDEKRHSLEDTAPDEEYHEDTPPSVWEFAPPTENASEPEPQEEEEVPNIISEVMHTEASAEMTRVFDTIPMDQEIPKPAKKKKIVITGELPDYEALRREEAERERQAQLANEAAAEEARAAERARRAAEAAAERQRLMEEAEQRRLAREEAERQRLAEEAERQRIAEEAERSRKIAEAAAEKRRLAEEAAERRRLEEEAEQRRLAEEAERQRIAEEEEAERRRLAEEAERQRIAEEEEAERQRLAEEAERQRIAEEAEQRRIALEEEKLRQIEEMKRLAAEAENTSDAAAFNEELIVNSSAENEVDRAIESLGEAAEETIAEAAPEIQAEEPEKPKKLGFFKKLINKGKDEPKPDTDTEPAPEEGLFEEDNSPSATELIDAAIAAINHPEDSESAAESDPVGDILDNIREGAAEAIADINTPKEEASEATGEPLILSDEDIIAGLSPELKERFDELSADKQQQVIEMRRAQMGAVAPAAAVSDDEPEDESYTEDNEPVTDTEAANENAAEAAEEETEKPAAEAEKTDEATEADEKKPKGRITSALGRILDEDPDELIAQRKENVEPDDITAGDPYKKKRLYTVLGVIFTIFAVIGIVATIIKCVGFFRSFTSGEAKKDSFTQMIYPAAIMDIEPFSDPSQLTSEQIITATIWSIIMDDSKISKYEPTLDTVSIPDVDVEKYAVELFGENLPAFEHATVGPLESRFYYADGVYNVRLKPITHTYSPEIKSIVKNGKTYTLNVDYVDELPQWMDKNVSKKVEFRLTEKDNGTFKFSSMKIISVNNGNI
jgi:hypothetical protein